MQRGAQGHRGRTPEQAAQVALKTDQIAGLAETLEKK